MSSWEAASLVIAVATGLMGLACGRLWTRMQAGSARRGRSGKLTALRAELDRQTQRVGRLEADLHAQQARGFALERELEARESDWAQSSPVPFSFDAQTFQIERSLQLEPPARTEDAARIAALEQQIRDLQDLLAKVSARPRPSRARSSQPARQAPNWVDPAAANGAPTNPAEAPGGRPSHATGAGPTP